MPAPARQGSFLSRLTLLAAGATALALAATARADEVRLHDGRVLVGKVTKKGDKLEVATCDGVVVVAADQVAQHSNDDELRQRLKALASGTNDSAFAHLQLAMQARAFGLEPELWRHLDRALAPSGQANPTAPLQSRLTEFLASLEPQLLPRKYRGASTAVRVHQLLERLQVDAGPGRTAAIGELLVREAGADQELRKQARRNTTPRRRIAALQALQQRELVGNDRFVLRTAILDGSEEVRQAAVQIGRPTVGADDIRYLASGLGHDNAKVRVRTADALGELGHPDAVKLLVLAGPHAATGVAAGGGQGERAHVAFLQQQAYIRDYDVEVAQAAFIADPKVDVLQSGVVLDVTVVGVIEIRTIVRAYRTALKKLTQADPGDDPRQWSRWLASMDQQQPTPTTPAPTTGQR